MFYWVDEDDDGLKEKPEDTRYIKIKIRPEAPGVWTKDLINLTQFNQNALNMLKIFR